MNWTDALKSEEPHVRAWGACCIHINSGKARQYRNGNREFLVDSDIYDEAHQDKRWSIYWSYVGKSSLHHYKGCTYFPTIEAAQEFLDRTAKKHGWDEIQPRQFAKDDEDEEEQVEETATQPALPLLDSAF